MSQIDSAYSDVLFRRDLSLRCNRKDAMKIITSTVSWIAPEPPVHVKVGKHNYIIDDPESSGGSDKAPSALQYFISSLGGCFIGMAQMIAGEMGIQINGVECRIEGDIDLAGLTGKDEQIRPGLQEIRMWMKVVSPAPAPRIKELVSLVEKRCPVKNCFDTPVPIKVEVVDF